MEVTRAVFVLVVIFVINVLFVSFGLANTDLLNQSTPTTGGIGDITDTNTMPNTNVNPSEEGGNLTDNPGLLRVIPDAGEGYDNFKAIKNNLGNLVWGYRNVFVIMGLPTTLVFLFTGIIGFIQILCLFTLIGSLISVFTGGGVR